MMYSVGSPLRRALWTNSSGLTASVALRITLLLLGINEMPIMKMTIHEWSMPLNRWVAILITRIASSSDGTARNQSTTRMIA